MLMLPEYWLKCWQGRDAFEKIFTVEGKVFREHEGRKTLQFTFNGKNYFAKLHRGVGWKEILKNLLQLRLPIISAKNEWQAVRHLEQLDIKTMHLVGYGKRGWNPAQIKSFVITEELVNTVSLEDFCRNWPNSPPSHSLKVALIREVAKIARTIHENGMNHRDFYICHFLLNNSKGLEGIENNGPSLYLIDLHRVQIRRRTPHRWRVKDIAGLYFSSMEIGLSKRDLFRFIQVYGNKPLKVSLEEDRAFWQQVSKRAIALYKKEFKKQPTLVW
jgi:heptose I phosphotransferase